MTPLIKTVHDQLELDIQTLDDAQLCLQDSLFEELITEGLIREIAVHFDGISLFPLSSAHALRASIQSKLMGVRFTRQLGEGGLYNWLTTFDRYNTQLWIIANESIDHTGTVVTSLPPEP